MLVNKQQAAKRQLLTAIELFLQGGDLLPIYGLIHAAFMITENIAAKKETPIETLYQILQRVATKEEFKKVLTYMRDKARYLKHADREKDEFEFEELKEIQVLAFMCSAINNYKTAFNENPPEMNVPVFVFLATIFADIKDRDLPADVLIGIETLVNYKANHGEEETRLLALMMFYKTQNIDIHNLLLAKLVKQ